ncbi:MAG TPA: hypothetical protein VMP68_19190 [Candidatus Eisenbacteria bacterium]|nr:hypothetical protein [Candidatus Eisenbacteria bacterium]
MKGVRFLIIAVLFLSGMLVLPLHSQTADNPANLPQRDGSHDFDFLIGDWRAHVRRLPDRLNNSNKWDEYDGISNHHKLLDSNANFEQFEVTSTDKKLQIKAQTLRMYNPATHQWSIYLIDLDNGTLELLPSWAPLTASAESFSIRKPSRAGRSLCATSGSICHRTRRAWSSPTRRTAARLGKSTGFVSYRVRADILGIR